MVFRTKMAANVFLSSLFHSNNIMSLFTIFFLLFLVSQALRENTYPFLALIVLRDNKMTVVARIEGPIGTQLQIIPHLVKNTFRVSCVPFTIDYK